MTEDLTMFEPPASMSPQRTRRPLLVVLGIVLAVCLGGAGLGIAGFVVLDNAERPVNNAVKDYLDNLQSRDFHEAYESMCTKAKLEIGSPEAFVDEMASQPQVDDYEIASSHIEDRNGADTATVFVNTSSREGEDQVLLLTLENGASGWKICPTERWPASG